jgi:hypothetical protein
MTITEIIVTQVAITLVVVALYHLWVSRKASPTNAPPNLNLNPNLKPPSFPAATPPAPSPAKISAPAVAAPIVLPPTTLPVAGPTPPEILAVIAAAVSVVLGRAHRVVSVQQSPIPEMNVWALEGRMKQFMSHKVR